LLQNLYFKYLRKKLVKIAKLILEDGTIWSGKSIGAMGTSLGEVVFNTAMTGYQEILSDPSYCDQIITLTYPHIGNTGVTEVDNETDAVVAKGLIIRDLPLTHSNWRAQGGLSDYLQLHNIIAIADIDTRSLTRHLRENGSMKACITTELDEEEALQQAKDWGGLQNTDLAKVVSTQEIYSCNQGSYNLTTGEYYYSKSRYKVVVYDFGVKKNILRMLCDRDCDLVVVPAQTPASEVLAMQPDGVFLSNGPGDPDPCTYAMSATKELLENNIPLFGICLGHQILGLASGATTSKMKFGHHGANHPVMDIAQQKVVITSQNHGFAIDSVKDNIEITHKSLFDDSIQGIKVKDKQAFGFQGHPEASPGPQDCSYLFDDFVKFFAKNK
jgi:carbamoyl-phosphate synthase small subunit